MSLDFVLRLPSVLPSETLFSRLIRGLTISGSSRPHYYFWLLGSSRASFHPYLTSNLIKIASKAEESANSLYLSQTLFPLFAHYLPSHSNEIYYSALSTPYGFRSCQLANFREHECLTLKYCPLCAMSDIKHFGVAYWHIEHQIPGIECCCSHPVWLLHKPLHKASQVHEGLLPCESSNTFNCNDKAFSFAKYTSKILQSIQAGKQLKNDYLPILADKGYVTKGGCIRRRLLATELARLVEELGFPYTELMPESERDYKYFSNLLKPNVNQHPFKHLLLAYCLSDLNVAQFLAVKPVLNRSLKPDPTIIEAQCLKLLKEGHSMAEISRRTGRSRCYIKTLALKENVEFESKPKIITKKVKLYIINLAKKGFHRREIANRYGISSGSVEQLISSRPDLVIWRRKCKSDSKRRRYKYTIMNFIKTHPLASRQDCKRSNYAAFYWLYNHEHDWLSTILPTAIKGCRNQRVDWKERDRKLSKQLGDLLSKNTESVTLTKLEQLLGAHGWLTRYRHKLPTAMTIIENYKLRNK